MQTSPVGSALRFFAIDIVADFLLFPVWWYTAGFVRVLRLAGRWLQDAREMMAIGVWVKNIFVPMFAQYDIWGRLISFLIRSVMIVARSIGFLISVFLVALFLVAYLLFPPLIAYLILIQFLGVFAS